MASLTCLSPLQDFILERFKSRSALVKRVCHYIGRNESIQDLKELVFIRDKNLLFCTIAKSASTFWRRILYAYGTEAKRSPFAVNYETAYRNARNHRVYETDNLQQIYQNSKSFVFVRHPFTRLFSGWLDKHFSLNPEFWKKHGIKVIESERGLKTPSCGHDVTFKEFVNFVSNRLVHSNGNDVNIHFTPSFSHCDVCSINFKFIGKYETLKEDTRFIMEEYGLGTNSSLFENFEDKSVLDMIDDAVNWVFSQKSKITHCLSFQCGLFRVWKRLICRGVISKKERFPYNTMEQAMRLTKEDFKKDLVAAHMRSNSSEVLHNREEVLAEAFQSLGKETFEKMLDAFKLDFDLFGYSTHEPYLDLRVTSNVNGFYLSECPY